MSHSFSDCTGTSYGKTVTKGNLVRQALFEICRCRGGGHLMKEQVFCLKRRVFKGEVYLCLSLMLISAEKFTII
jgi:hypothetical protein